MTDHKHSHRILIWIDAALAAIERPDEIDTTTLLLHILKGQLVMALNLATLTDDVAALSAGTGALKTAVDVLIALHTDPSQQAAVDALATSIAGVTTAVAAVTAAVTAVLPPAPTPEPVPAPAA
jgi:hypothetical protein